MSGGEVGIGGTCLEHLLGHSVELTTHDDGKLVRAREGRRCGTAAPTAAVRRREQKPTQRLASRAQIRGPDLGTAQHDTG